MFRLRRLTFSLLLAGFFTAQITPTHAAEFTQEELAYLPASVQLPLFKQGLLSPVEVLEAQIKQFEQYNEKINATTYTHFEAARKQAKEAEKRYQDGTYRPLEGITVALKDEHHDKGMKVTMGSLVHKDDPPKKEADVMAKKLKAAGAIFSMQTTVPELYLNFTTNTKAWGTTRNPWNLKYTPGGSSGGSGAALAAGFTTLATGSDMGGSIRIPAAVNGLYGYKVAFGQIHSDIPLAHFSSSGPLARTYEDLVLFQNIITGPDEDSVMVLPSDYLPSQYDSIKGMKIAYVGGMGVSKPTPEVEKAMQNAIKVLRKAGAKVETVKLNLGVPADDMANSFSKAALSGSMGGLFTQYAEHTDKMTPYGAYFVQKTTGGEFGNKQLLEAENLTKAMYKKIADAVFIKGYDALLCPTMPTTHIPAEHDVSKDTVKDGGIQYNKFVGSHYTVPFNILNWMPVISVPAGLSKQNMPIGMQIVTRPYDSKTAFQIAYNYSKHAPRFFTGKRMPQVE